MISFFIICIALFSYSGAEAANARIELMCKPNLLWQSAQKYACGYDLKSPLISPLFADLSGYRRC